RAPAFSWHCIFDTADSVARGRFPGLCRSVAAFYLTGRAMRVCHSFLRYGGRAFRGRQGMEGDGAPHLGRKYGREVSVVEAAVHGAGPAAFRFLDGQFHMEAADAGAAPDIAVQGGRPVHGTVSC